MRNIKRRRSTRVFRHRKLHGRVIPKEKPEKEKTKKRTNKTQNHLVSWIRCGVSENGQVLWKVRKKDKG